MIIGPDIVIILNFYQSMHSSVGVTSMTQMPTWKDIEGQIKQKYKYYFDPGMSEVRN